MSRGGTLLVFGRRGGGLGEWLLLGPGGVAARGSEVREAPKGAGRRVLAVPSEQAALHWIELAPELSQAQAAAAARLIAADLSAEPITDIHVAVGPARGGRRCVALSRSEIVAGWISEAKAHGFDPDAVVPDSLLLPPNEGWTSRDAGEVALYRGPEAAFAIEPEVARSLPGAAQARALAEPEFEAGLEDALAAPDVDLRQGPFARRREWRADAGAIRRIAVLGIALAMATLAVQVATIFHLSAAAERMEEEARRIAGGGDLAGRLAALRGGGAGFPATAGALFAAIEATPGAELVALVFEPSGTMRASVQALAPGAFGALRDRIAAQGFAVSAGPLRTAGGRHAADLLVTPR